MLLNAAHVNTRLAGSFVNEPSAKPVVVPQG